MKSSKTLSVLVLVLLSLLLTTFTFAYWAGSVTPPPAGDKTHSVKIGEGDDVSTEMVINLPDVTSFELVPAGKVKNESKQTDKVQYTFSVKWSSTDKLASGEKGF